MITRLAPMSRKSKPAVSIRREVRAVSAYHLNQPVHRMKLNQNESAYDLPPALKARILKKLAKLQWNRYPSPYADGLRERIAQREGWRADGVLVANGSNVLTQSLVMATAVGGKIAIPDPTFSLYELYGRLFKNQLVKIPLQKDFSLDLDRFLSVLKQKKPDLTFIPNPSAPTGNLFPKKELTQLVKATSNIIVVDEAYYPFSGETLVPLLKRQHNLVIMRTFSKAFSLGGARVGYILGQPAVIQEVQKVLPPFCLNALSAAVAETALSSAGYVDKIVKEVGQEREQVFQALSALPGIEVFPSMTNFILFRTREPERVFKALVKAGVLIRNVSDGKRLKNCLRVTIGKPRENRQFIKAMQQLS